MGRDNIEIIHIPIDPERIISASSKGDQSKWRIGNKWVKQNARGYEGQAEVLPSLVIKCLTCRVKTSKWWHTVCYQLY